jgi:hypothetical protein
MVHLTRWATGEREYVRPDIVIAKGDWDKAEKPDKFDIIVECKERSFGSWQKDIDGQITNYLQSFGPKRLVIAEMKSVPDQVKSGLANAGIDTADEFSLYNKHAIDRFTSQIRQSLR